MSEVIANAGNSLSRSEGHLCIGQPAPETWHPSFTIFESVEEVLSLNSPVPMLVIALAPEQQDEILIDLRSQTLTALSLIFVVEDSLLSPYLANGVFDERFQNHLDDYLDRLQMGKLYDHGNQEFLLLSYLWLHEDCQLSPMKMAKEPCLYQYPLLSSWDMDPMDSFIWLTKLCDKGWLETVELTNRVRYSPCCQSGHLNYIDLCPQCQGIDIQLQSSLHCFNCGHVAPQEDFRKTSSLSCPNCLQSLRHIGVDYDRPIETQRCNSCDSLFIDAEVQASCLDCDTLHSLSSLLIRNLHRYKLSLAGRLLVHQGALSNLFANQAGNQMSFTQFCWLIDWQNKLAKRHGQIHSILAVKLLNIEQLTRENCDFSQLETLQERISTIVRTTDACSQYTEEGLLLFLPFTDQEQLKMVYKKFYQLKGLDSLPIEFNIRAITLPDDMGENVKDWLMDKLAAAESL